MAKGQDIAALARAALESNRDDVMRVCKLIVANEPDTSSLKQSLQRLLNRSPARVLPQESFPTELRGLVLQFHPERSLVDTVVPDSVRSEIAAFLEDQSYVDALRAAGLAAPHKLLLCGPPGNGKTTLAGAIANALDLPFYVVDYSAVVSSRLGETGENIAKVFRGVTLQPSVLFFDEMETVFSERSGFKGRTDVAEMARTVSTILLEIDRLPDHVILVGSTNHEEMLDRAVVRRFDYCWHLEMPTRDLVDSWLQSFANRYPDLPVLTEMPLIDSDNRSLSDIEREVMKWCRNWVVKTQRATLRAVA